jgi:hypothetical protein
VTNEDGLVQVQGAAPNTTLFLLQPSPGEITEITYELALSFLSAWHYLNYVPKLYKYYGWWDERGLAGVAVIGLVQSRGVLGKLFGDTRLRACELNRFALRDDLPTNSESYFLSRLLKVLRGRGYEAVISYADPEYQHKGVIYQATNWLYTGLSDSDTKPRYFIDGIEVPPRSLYNWHGTQGVPAMKAIYGDRLVLKPRFNKHRYIAALTRKAKNALRIKLPYPVTA